MPKGKPNLGTALAGAAAFAPFRDAAGGQMEPRERRDAAPGIASSRSNGLKRKDLPLLMGLLCLVMLGGRPGNGDMAVHSFDVAAHSRERLSEGRGRTTMWNYRETRSRP